MPYLTRFKTLLALSLLPLLMNCENIDVAEMKTPADTSKPEIVTVDRYFSPYSFGPLMRLYNYEADNVILKVRISNDALNLPIKATLYQFDPLEDDKAIAKWINNQHSDGLYPIVAQPIQQQDVSNEIKITSVGKGQEVIGQRGEIYSKHEITYLVEELKIGSFMINSFADTVYVHVRMTDL